MLCLSVVLTSCSKKIPHGVGSKVFVDDSIRHPKRYKYKNPQANQYGQYECGSDLYLCTTFHDASINHINVESLFSAHQSLINLIDAHNRRVDFDNNVLPDEVQCCFLCFKCKAEKNKGMGQ